MQEIIKKVLLRLEETSGQFWNIPKDSGNIMNLIIKAAGYKNILEVGTSNGYSSIWLAEAARYNSGHVTTMEYYQERIELAQANIEEAGLQDFVTLLQGKALDILPVIKIIPDFVFIDANKAEYLAYFEIINSILESGGMFAADNVTSHKGEMEDFLDSISKNINYQTTYLPFGGGLLLALKK